MTTWWTKATCGAARLAARKLWGNEASVLVGDFLLGQAFRMMVEVGSLRALEILSNAAVVIAEGEVMQLAAAKNTATTEDDYLAVIRGKTAELFAAACEVGPVLAGRSKDDLAACRSFGMNLGIAFQLVDDALDYGGKAAKLGKNVGDDFREGKITLPVVLSFRRGNAEERSFWTTALEKGEASEADLEYAIALMTRHRALEDTIKRAQHYGSMAKDALALFPASPIKQALEEAVDFCIARAHSLDCHGRASDPLCRHGHLSDCAQAAHGKRPVSFQIFAEYGRAHPPVRMRGVQRMCGRFRFLHTE